MQHVATGCTGDVRECKKISQEWHRVLCAVCRGGGKKAADEFHFEDAELECDGVFVYLGNMLNDTGGVEQAVTTRERAV